MNKNLKKYIELTDTINKFEKDKIPLCAAETYISDFCKKPLISNYEGKYSFVDKEGNNTFIGGEYIDKLNQLISDQCKILFNADYTNADTMTGINCFTICAMSLLSRGDSVLLTTPEQGGRPSIPFILDSLGVNYDSMPYNFDNYQINYSLLNKIISNNTYKFMIFCQSDIITPPDLTKIIFNNNMGILYDATQTLGLICNQVIANPLDVKNVVLIGGAHKTLPAPSCGLIMTNTMNYSQKLKVSITPNYLRNTQPNHIAAMLLALIEQQEFGKEYQKKIIITANLLGQELENLGFKLAKLDIKTYTNTHQLFILMNEFDTNQFYYNAQKYNITLNQKHKKLFKNDGIRIGTQQIARYNWNQKDITCLAYLLFYLQNVDIHHEKILILRDYLISRKIPHFTFENISIE